MGDEHTVETIKITIEYPNGDKKTVECTDFVLGTLNFVNGDQETFIEGEQFYTDALVMDVTRQNLLG